MKTKKILFVLASCFFAANAFSQAVNVEDIGNIFKNKPFTFSGGLSAGSVFYGGNQQSGRQNWTYYISGSLNTSIYGQINIPININITNLGKNMSYPSLPNRLSLHPTYKWITGHIGDVSMSFSPYTLNGHQFTGGGVEMNPGKFKIGIMGGRLLKKVEYSAQAPSLTPNYERFGYGIKTQYNAEKYSAGLTYFAAKDTKDTQMEHALDSLGIKPLQNSVIGFDFRLNLLKNITLLTEYAVSFVTHDTRAPKDEEASFVENIFGAKTSTGIYNALNAKLNWQLAKNVIGIGYERIDPNYKTLGAYYFNNDYENITLNYARPFLKGDKANVALSFGVQRDDLKNQNDNNNTRYTGSVNLNYNPSEAMQISANYSTFQSYRNLKSQFDYINEISPYDNMDTLNYTQLSQTIDGSVTYSFKQTESMNQRLNLAVSYQESADRQGDVALQGNVSRFLNSAMIYNLSLIKSGINITASANYSYSYGGLIETHTFGPMLGVTAGLLNKKLTTGFSASYNVNMNSGQTQIKVLNLRANAAIAVLKKHNISANIVWQNRNLLTTNKKTDAITATFAYSFSF
ncbi:MAG: hypothetical protein LBP63_09540 [Prevotellaceae bacterium]|jgi:hypothetical protein|nr:hypothetical protein [Prevotellaceae bacterium]